jgi:CRISPR/Cas system CSM-associated protein Csm3 (group 7 of RAMP superfamily)
MYSDIALITRETIGRWRLTGTIRALSPLHLGDGGEAKLSSRPKVASKGNYATVFTAHDGKPILPGSSIKGALRAWAEAHLPGNPLIPSLFGTLAEGSGLTFHDASLVRAVQPAQEEVGCSHWDAGRGTAILAHVVIDPRTASAAEKLLFHTEFVAAGSEFTFQITGQGVAEGVRKLLLFILNHSFTSAARPAVLGSEVANGWGRVCWQPTRVEVLNLDAWLNSPPKPWTDALTELTGPARDAWLAPADLPVPGPSADSITLHLTLQFQGHLLINDPTRKREGDSRGRGAVGRAVIRCHDGKPYLPASSVRGAFRSRARRIWQTLAWDGSEDLNKALFTSAPRRGSQTSLASFLKMFGATGWRSPLEFADFELQGSESVQVKELVAIDRFTGCVAGEKKFNAYALFKPKFTGDVRIRTDRLASAGAGDWTWLLLLYTLRDWIEGDGAIGSGPSKGWGRFRTSVRAQGAEPAGFIQKVLDRNPEALADPLLDKWQQSLLAEIGKGVRHGEVL